MMFNFKTKKLNFFKLKSRHYSQMYRLKVWEELHQKREEEGKKIEAKELEVKLKDGKTLHFLSPLDGYKIASTISNNLSKNALAAKLDGKLIDLSQQINDGSNVEIVTYREDDLGEIFLLFYYF